jgi:hypothetical protein
VKAGNSVPVKFSLGGNRGMSIFEAGYPRSGVVGCTSQADATTTTATGKPGQSLLSYSASTDTYTYTWKTETAWRDCRQLVVKTADGGTHRANFQFTK